MKPVIIGVAALVAVTAAAVVTLLLSVDKQETVEGILVFSTEPGLCGLADEPKALEARHEQLSVDMRLSARGVRTVLDRATCEKSRAYEGKRVRAHGRRVALFEATGRSDLSNLSAIATHDLEVVP